MEGKQLVGAELATSKIEEAKALFDKHQKVGSDASEWASALFDALKEWVESFTSSDLTTDGVTMIVRFVIDWLIPKILDTTPMYVDLFIKMVIIPLLEKLIPA